MYTLFLKICNFLLNGLSALCNSFVAEQSHLALALRLHHAYQVGVGHGCERMVLHSRFIQQQITHKQITFENGASVVRECRGRNGEVGLKRLHQGFGHRADIALGSAVEGRTVFEINLLCALFLQPL